MMMTELLTQNYRHVEAVAVAVVLLLRINSGYFDANNTVVVVVAFFFSNRTVDDDG